MTDHIWIHHRISKEELCELIEKARLENHGVFLQTHPLKRDGELIGYFSVGSPGYPVVFAWLGECIQARESFSLINSIENHVVLAGANGVCFPVPKNSPFHPLMEHMGFKNGGTYDFFVKNFEKG